MPEVRSALAAALADRYRNDIAPDGRFLLMKSRGGARVVIDVVLNWIAEVRAQLTGIKK